jgi:hypothetical protein
MVGKICFVFDFIPHAACTVDAWTYQSVAFTVLDTYNTLYAGHKGDASVGLSRRRRFLD